ncbi:MAG: aspartate 1-decarboxylase [Planctomycetes bacterium]|nr:aspartate 1-decarboxylase [Planctomycetota bacterium]
MLITILKSKLHRATVTDACLDYEGSISIPEKLAELAGLHVYEKVLVANITNGNRFETYVIPGEDGKIILNGAAARLGKKDDKIIVMAWAILDNQELAGFQPKIVILDEKNQPKKQK